MSTKLPPLNTLGPALVITKLKVIVAPSPTVVTLASFATPKLTAGATLNVALPTFVFAPTVVVSDPIGIEFVTVPDTVLVTTVVTVQRELGGMTVPIGKVRVPKPVLTDGTPTAQLVDATELKLTRPAGYASVNTPDNVADVSACVLVIVIVSRAVPPARIEPGLKALVMIGGEAVTASVSVAKQTPLAATHKGLVLATLIGGVMVATLTT